MTTLRRVLFADAASCVGMGLFLALLAEPLAPMLGLPGALQRYAGFALLPVGAFMAWVATRPQLPLAGVWTVIVGNVGWVAASAALLLATAPTTLGYVFVIGQALVVAALAELEYVSTRAARAAAASA